MSAYSLLDKLAEISLRAQSRRIVSCVRVCAVAVTVKQRSGSLERQAVHQNRLQQQQCVLENSFGQHHLDSVQITFCFFAAVIVSFVIVSR